jgi:hypothetical protein
MGANHCHVVFEPVLANCGKQLAQDWHLANGDATVHVEFLVDKRAFAKIGFNAAFDIIRGYAEKCHVSWFHMALDRSKTAVSSEGFT